MDRRHKSASQDFRRGLTPDPNNKFLKFIEGSSSEKAESGWGNRDRRKGLLDSEVLRQTEKLFSVQRGESVNTHDFGEVPIEVSEEFPKISGFSEIDIHNTLLKNIAKMRYKVPTPVQSIGIPIAILRRDLMGCAQTGSGKTAAFLVPIIAKMLNEDPPPFSNSRAAIPVSLVLAPTRELSIQIFEEALKFTYRTGIRTAVVYGGADPRLQGRELSKGVDVLIATPGRLIDFVSRGRVDLRCVQYLVLDEADRMLDMGFEPQIRSILQEIPDQKETVMYSATFPPQIQSLAAQFMKDYVFLSIGRVGSTTEAIEQRLEYVEEDDKKDLLKELVGGMDGLILVFVEMKRSADIISQYLQKCGFQCTCIHGDRTQPERERALKEFKDRKKNILVATDVAARGLDIPDVSYVINYDTPMNIDDYVHRIGRTGRIGNKGVAYSFINEKNKPILRDLHNLLVESNQRIPDWFEKMNRSQIMAIRNNKQRRFKSINW